MNGKSGDMLTTLVVEYRDICNLSVFSFVFSVAYGSGLLRPHLSPM